MHFYGEYTGLIGFPVHDSSAIAYVVDPTLFETKKLYVEVEYHSPLHMGQTVADWRQTPAGEPNVNVCVDVDSDRFLALYHKRLTEI